MRKALHKKTGKIYYIMDTITNATNSCDGEKVVLYKNSDNEVFVREENEFYEKFKVTEVMDLRWRKNDDTSYVLEHHYSDGDMKKIGELYIHGGLKWRFMININYYCSVDTNPISIHINEDTINEVASKLNELNSGK